MSVERVIGSPLSLYPGEPLILPWACLCSDNRRFTPIGGRNCLTTEYTRAKSSIRDRAKLWWRGREPLSADCQLEARFWFPDRIKRDSGNYGKAICDALTKIVYDDDGRIARVIYQRAGYDKPNARCEVTVMLLSAHAEAA